MAPMHLFLSSNKHNGMQKKPQTKSCNKYHDVNEQLLQILAV